MDIHGYGGTCYAYIHLYVHVYMHNQIPKQLHVHIFSKKYELPRVVLPRFLSSALPTKLLRYMYLSLDEFISPTHIKEKAPQTYKQKNSKLHLKHTCTCIKTDEFKIA